MTGPDHGGNPSGIADRLGLYFCKAFLVITNIVDELALLLAGFPGSPGDEATDAGLAFGERTERGRVGKDLLEELKGGDFFAADFNGLDGGHAHIFKHGEVIDVVVGEGHPEADAL